MATVPGATPVTTPDDDTVATAAFPVCHVIAVPGSTEPLASRAVAVSVVVEPTFTVGDDGDTVIVCNGPGAGAVTVTGTLAETLPLEAVTVVFPAPAPATRPDWFTVATDELALDQLMDTPLSTVPEASSAVAITCCVPPTTRLSDVGVSVIAARGPGPPDVTVIDAVPVCPSLVAVIVVLPAATPVTTPD
jgi:hypothetical protein